MNEIQRLTIQARNGAMRTGLAPGVCGGDMGLPDKRIGSWKSSCPPGYCPPDHLPDALGRYFAGDRSGCRDMPYVFFFSGQASGTPVEINITSVADMCPLRIMAGAGGSAGLGLENWSIDSIKFGNEEQIAGDSILALALAPDAYQTIPIVPACMRTGQPVQLVATPTTVTAPDDTFLYVALWGPAVA